MATADGENSAAVDAVILGEIERESLLLSEGSPLDLQTTAKIIIDKGPCEVFKFLLSNYKLDVNKHFLLHRALVVKQEDIAKLLVESGAEVNIYEETGSRYRDCDEQGCAHYSCYLPLQLSLFCSFDMTRFLLKSGADVNKQNYVGETPIIFACGTSVSPDKVAFLLANRANVHAKDRIQATGLHWAVRVGNIETVTLLIDHGADIEAEDAFGCTPLMWACRNSVDVACLKVLLEKGAECRTVTFRRETGLHEAVKSGNSMALKLLIQYGAQLEARTLTGDTALILACGESVPAECVRILLENKAVPNVRNRYRKTPLIMAKQARNEEKILMLLHYGATEEDWIDREETGLMLTCRKSGNVKSVLNVLQNNASPNVKNQRGQTAFHIAADTGDIEILKALVQYKADVNAMTDDDITPLMMACANSSVNVECVQFLLEQKALPNVTDATGDTALSMAIHSRGIEKVQILLQYDADVNVRDGNGKTLLALTYALLVTGYVRSERKHLLNVADMKVQTALHLLVSSYDMADLTETTVSSYNEMFIKRLVKEGADLEARTSVGETPFLIAVQKGNDELIDLLIDLGADVCAEDWQGQNAIMLAIQATHTYRRTCKFGFLRSLIDKGVSVNHRDKNGWTPLMLAAEYEDLEGINLLIKAGADIHAVRTKNTALSIALEKSGPDIDERCADRLIRHGAVNSLPKRYNSFLHQMIWFDNRRKVKLLLTNGMAPTISKNFVPHQCDFFESVSPLTLALYLRNVPVIQYLLGNLMLCPYDIYGHSYFSQWRQKLISENKTDVVTMMDEFYSQPKSLFQLSFVTVSHALGGVPGRVDRINSLPLPSKVKDMLLFRNIDVPMDVRRSKSYYFVKSDSSDQDTDNEYF